MTQETMLRLWRIAPDWEEDRAALGTWLYRVASQPLHRPAAPAPQAGAGRGARGRRRGPRRLGRLEAARPGGGAAPGDRRACPTGSGWRSCSGTSRSAATRRSPRSSGSASRRWKACSPAAAASWRRGSRPRRAELGFGDGEDRGGATSDRAAADEAALAPLLRRSRRRWRRSRRCALLRRSSPTPPRSPPRGSAPPRRRRARPGAARGAVEPIGGWRGLAALAACAAFGFWLGLAGGVTARRHDAGPAPTLPSAETARTRSATSSTSPRRWRLEKWPTRRRRDWLKWALVASLGLNLAFAGVIGGALLKGPPPPGRARALAATPARCPNLTGATSAGRCATAAATGPARARRCAASSAALAAALTAEPFRARSGSGHCWPADADHRRARDPRRPLLVAQIGRMSPEERAAYAEALRADRGPAARAGTGGCRALRWSMP